MRNKHWILVAAAALVACYALFFRQSDEQAIAAMLEAILKRGRQEKLENPIVTALTAKELSECFTERAEIDASLEDGQLFEIRGRDEIAKEIAMLKRYFSLIEPSISKPVITVRSGKATARFRGTARVKPANESKIREASGPVEIELDKSSGDWLISRARNTEEVAVREL